MNFIKKFIAFITNKFRKKEVKTLEEAAPNDKNGTRNKEQFIKNLKVETEEQRTKIETPICVGDGLGIKKGMKS